MTGNRSGDEAEVGARELGQNFHQGARVETRYDISVPFPRLLVGERERRHESLPALIAKEIENHIRFSVCVRVVSLYTDECDPTLLSVCPRAPNTPPQWLDTEQIEEALPRGHTPMRLHWCKSKQSMKVMTL